MTDLLGHFLLFGVFIVGFLLVALLIGRFIRPKLPTPEKTAIYECGEPTIGTISVHGRAASAVMARLRQGGFQGGPLVVECLQGGSLEQLQQQAQGTREFLEKLTEQ